MSIRDLIQKRRSIYPAQFTGEKVDDKIILEALDAANHAPNHGKTEPWRFVIFKGDKLNDLARFQADLYKSTTSKELFNEKKFEKFFFKAEVSSHIIAIVHHRKADNKIPEIEEHEAIGCAVQNLHLSLTANHVGGYWSSGGGVYTKYLDEFLSLANNETCLGLFYVGVAKADPRPIERGALTDKIRWF